MTQTATIHEAHHEHPAHLAHHFESLQQQYDSGKLGIWLFLTTEILMFSGLFCGYSVLRSLHPEIFVYAHHYLSVELGALNTVVLIFSSFTMAWGVRAAQLGQTKLLVRLLGITLACAAFIFLFVKFVEYKAKWEEALLPGSYYNPNEPPQGINMPAAHHQRKRPRKETGEKETVAKGASDKPADAKSSAAPAAVAAVGERSQIGPAAIGPAGLSEHWLERSQLRHDVVWHGPEPYNVQLFFGIYFAMTGLHGIHVIAGILVIAWLIVQARKGIFGPDRFAAVDFVGSVLAPGRPGVDFPVSASVLDYVSIAAMMSHPSAETSSTHASAHSGLGHVVPLWLLAAVFGALIALTGLTVAVAHVDLGNLNLYVALAIATLKSSLVVLFFMHLFWDRPFNSMIFIGCLLFVSLFIGITLTDQRASDPAAIGGQGPAMQGVHTPLGEPAQVSERPGEPRIAGRPAGSPSLRRSMRGEPGNDRFHRRPDDVFCS